MAKPNQSIEKRENWLDIAIAWGRRNEMSNPLDMQRLRRIQRLWASSGLSPDGPTGEEWGALGDFSRGVATWSVYSDEGRKHLDVAVREQLQPYAWQESDPAEALQMAKISFDTWVLKTHPVVQFTITGNSLSAGVTTNGAHSHTTGQFFEFLRSPRPVRLCDYCGAPFAGRADARFCSTGCRTAAAREKSPGEG